MEISTDVSSRRLMRSVSRSLELHLQSAVSLSLTIHIGSRTHVSAFTSPILVLPAGVKSWDLRMGAISDE